MLCLFSYQFLLISTLYIGLIYPRLLLYPFPRFCRTLRYSKWHINLSFWLSSKLLFACRKICFFKVFFACQAICQKGEYCHLFQMQFAALFIIGQIYSTQYIFRLCPLSFHTAVFTAVWVCWCERNVLLCTVKIRIFLLFRVRYRYNEFSRRCRTLYIRYHPYLLFFLGLK